MVKVTKKENETFDDLLKRYRRGVVEDGVLSVLKKKRYYVKPGELKREAKKKAIKKYKKSNKRK